MATITQSTGAPKLENPADIDKLERLHFYEGTLTKVHWVVGSAEWGSKRRMVLDWNIPEVGGQVRDYVGLALGTSNSGQVARLKTILNAIAGQPENADIALFHDDGGDGFGKNAMSWSYDGGKTYAGTLQPGTRVRFHGKVVPRNDGQGSLFTISEYAPVNGDSAPVATAVAPSAPSEPTKAAAAEDLSNI